MNKKQYTYLTFILIQSIFCGLTARPATKTTTESTVTKSITTIAPSIHTYEQVAILSSLLGSGYIAKGFYTFVYTPKKQDGTSLTAQEKKERVRSAKRYITVGSVLCVPLAWFALAQTVIL